MAKLNKHKHRIALGDAVLEWVHHCKGHCLRNAGQGALMAARCRADMPCHAMQCHDMQYEGQRGSQTRQVDRSI